MGWNDQVEGPRGPPSRVKVAKLEAQIQELESHIAAINEVCAEKFPSMKRLRRVLERGPNIQADTYEKIVGDGAGSAEVSGRDKAFITGVLRCKEYLQSLAREMSQRANDSPRSPREQGELVKKAIAIRDASASMLEAMSSEGHKIPRSEDDIRRAALFEGWQIVTGVGYDPNVPKESMWIIRNAEAKISARADEVEAGTAPDLDFAWMDEGDDA